MNPTYRWSNFRGCSTKEIKIMFEVDALLPVSSTRTH